MPYDFLDDLDTPIPEESDFWKNLNDKERRKVFERCERVGIVAPEKDGVLTELKQGAHGAAIDFLRGIGSTLEETTGYSGMREYFDDVKSRNRHLEPYKGYKAASLDPTDIARTIGSGAAQSALSLGAGVATTLFTGGNVFAGAAASTGAVFGQIYGDRVKDYRERMPDQSELTVRGLAFASALGESMIESVCGPEAVFTGIAKRWVTGALKDTTKSFVKQVGREAAKGFITEGSEEVLQDMWDRVCLRAGTENVSLPTWDEVKENFMGGAWSGLALGGIGGAVEHVRPVKRSDAAAGADATDATGVSGVTDGPVMDGKSVKPEMGIDAEGFDRGEHSQTVGEALLDEFGIKHRRMTKEEQETEGYGYKTIDGERYDANGFFDEKTGEIVVNPDNEGELFTHGHELKHWIDVKAPDVAKAIDEVMEREFNEKSQEELKNGMDLREFKADRFGEILRDPQTLFDTALEAEKVETGYGEKFIRAVIEYCTKAMQFVKKHAGLDGAEAYFNDYKAVRNEAAKALAELKKRSMESEKRHETEAGISTDKNGDHRIPELTNISDLNIDPDRFQFKGGADKKGITRPLQGEFDQSQARPIYVWEDNAGNKFVVEGHHRLDLAKRSGVKDLLTYTDRETDGVTADQAREKGIWKNIKDGKGSIQDFADYFRKSDITEEHAGKLGLFTEKEGRTGFTIGKYASDNLYDFFKAGDIDAKKAEIIAEIARGDEGLEAAGIRVANNMPKEQLSEFMKCMKSIPRETTEQGDLFGFDDSAIQISEKISKLATKHIKDINDKLKAVKQAIANPDTAAKGDVKVGKNAKNIYDKTLREKAAWEHWYTDPELSSKLREEAGIEPVRDTPVTDVSNEESSNVIDAVDVGNTQRYGELLNKLPVGMKRKISEILKTGDERDQESKLFKLITHMSHGPTKNLVLKIHSDIYKRINADVISKSKSENPYMLIMNPDDKTGGLYPDMESAEKVLRGVQKLGYTEAKIVDNPDYKKQDTDAIIRGTAPASKVERANVPDKNVGKTEDVSQVKRTGKDDGHGVDNDGRFNMDSDTPLLTPEEDANDFQLMGDTFNERQIERDRKSKQGRAEEEAKRATPDLFSDNVGNGGVTDKTVKAENTDKLDKRGNGYKHDGVTENIYLRMPIDRVRQDAENGVKLAQDALKILEKQTATDYINDKEKNNASSTSTNLERGSEVRDIENSPDATSLFDDGRTDLRVSGQGGRSTGSAGIRVKADTGDADAASESDGTGGGAVDGRTLSGDRTGATDRQQSSGGVDGSQSGIRAGDDTNGSDADNHAAEGPDRKAKSQQEADRVKVIQRDRKNIAETLPTLYPEQCDDVYKAENRFLNGKGMLFTNATGTGKTFTGLGIIKRFVRDGLGNILIVTPTDKKNRDWSSDAKNLNLAVTPLTGISDNGGTGIAVTTYANFRQNESLKQRNWDLLVFDESHKISSAEGKIDTLAKRKLDYLAGGKDFAFRRAFEENKALLRDELAKIDPDYKRYDLEYTQNSVNPSLSLRDVETHFEELPKNVQKLLKDREAELTRSKVLFLSATPFSYHNSLLYADGYLFDIPKEESRGYGKPDGEQKFFIENFGYRMRYNKLTKPDSDVDVGVMERAFYEKLRKSGAVSGRMLEIDKDYSREFFQVRSELGEKIQAGMDIVYDSNKYPYISSYLSQFYDYNYITSLLECLKAKATVDEIKKDLAAGRKVVVFHNRNTGKPAHPFDFGSLYKYCETEYEHQEIKKELERFETEHPELVHLKLNDLQNPIMYFRKIFGDKALFFDGTVPAKIRSKNVDEFNDSKSGKNLIVVQIEAGKEGISLHDKKGDSQRVLYNLGLPTKPTDLIQSEGRIYRLGTKSNAIFRYPVTGLPMERYAFGSKINERASTAENLGMGDAARNLRVALRDGYMNAGESLPFEQQGIGGKEADRGYNTSNDYERAKTFYFAQMKRTSKNKSAEGTDYYATPEPIGYKMVEWLGLEPGDKVLEPSAGHGAIARFFPETVDAKAIEPSNDLYSKLSVNTTAKVIHGRFEDHSPFNKYDCIVMNPPFGNGGKTAIEHLSKAFDQHLRELGRMIAIIPEGSMSDRRFIEWLDNTEEAHLTAEIGLPNVTFQRAGTSVKTKIVVIDKADMDNGKYLSYPQQRIDISAENIKELFDRMENITIPERGSFDHGRSYSLKRTPKNIDDYRVMEARPRPEKVSFSSVKELYDIYKKEYFGKTFRTISGHDITFKPGHFFRLIAGTPNEGIKGLIAKASNSEEAIRMIENGEIDFSDIAGYQSNRAKNIRLFKDVLQDGDFWYSGDGKKIIFGKKYQGLKKADGFIAVTLELDNNGELGPVSFYPKQFTNKMFDGKNINWNIVNTLDHTKALGDISSRGKSAELTSNVNQSSEKSSADSENFEVNNSGRYFSLVRDAKKKRALDEAERNGEVIHTYRAAQLVDGKLYPPMAGRINGDWGNPIQLGEWEQADEHPELVKEANGKYKFKLDKGNGSSIEAAYNPYIHSSPTPLNDQFSSAYKRPELVTLEVIVPKSELTSGYRADMAKDSVGMMEWKAGVVQGKLTGKRKVMLSRWDKPIRIVPDSEVAEKISEMLDGNDVSIPANVVTPQLRKELEKIGVPVTDNLRNYSLKRHQQVNPIIEDGEVRREYADLLEDKEYTPETISQWDSQAIGWIKRQGGVQGAAEQIASGTAPMERHVANLVREHLLNSEIAGLLSPELRQAVAEKHIEEGLSWGREGAARRLASLTMKSIENARAIFRKLHENMPDEDLKKLRNKILDEEGIDVYNLPPGIINDKKKLDAVLRAELSAKSKWYDKGYEYWINAILSAPSTHAANVIGNTVNAAYELGAKRFAEAAINSISKRKDGASFGEFKEMWKAFDFKNAWGKAVEAFDLETLTPDSKFRENATVAIPGKAGRAIRTPGRLLVAADAFARELLIPVEAASRAYREAKAMGLKGKKMQDYVQEKMSDPASKAYRDGLESVKQIIYQEDPGGVMQKLIAMRNGEGPGALVLKYMLPFIKTPANILNQSLRKSPLGIVKFAGETVQALRGKRGIDSEYLGHAAEQMLAWGAFLMLGGFGSDDDDDETKPFITGSSAPYGSGEQKYKSNEIPPYSIRIGDTYYSYKRIEPLAAGLSLIADARQGIRDAKNGKEVTNVLVDMIRRQGKMITEKSYLDSINQIYRFMEDPERSVESFGTNFVSSWVPNVMKQVLNSMEDETGDFKSREKGEEFLKDQFHVITSRSGFTSRVPKVDLFGHEITKEGAEETGGAGEFLWRLMVPVNRRKIDEEHPGKRLIENYNMTHPETQWWGSVPNYKFTIDKKGYYFGNEDYHEFAMKSGQLAEKKVLEGIRRGFLSAENPTDKDIELMKKIFARARKEVRASMYRAGRFEVDE